MLWFGELISQTGHQITMVALFVQVDRITGSTAAVGAVGFVRVFPMILSSFAIGPVIDTRDRRRILITAQFALMLTSMVLLVGALAGEPSLVLVYGAAAANAALLAIVDADARRR